MSSAPHPPSTSQPTMSSLTSAALTARGQDVGRMIADAVQQIDDVSKFVYRLASIVLDQSDCLGVWISQPAKKTGTDAPSISIVPVSQSCRDLSELVGESLTATVTSALNQKTTHCHTSPNHSGLRIIASPIHCADTALVPDQPTSIAGCFDGQSESELRQQWLMTMVAQAISNWTALQAVRQGQSRNESLSDALTLMQRLGQTTDTSDSARMMANQLNRILGCNQVVVSLGKNPASAKISAVSGVESVDQESQFAQTTIAAIQQPLTLGRSLTFSTDGESSSVEDLALSNYCEAANCESVLAAPFYGPDQTLLGAVLIAGDAAKIAPQPFQNRVRQTLALMAGQLATAMRANRSFYQACAQKLTQYWNRYQSKLVVASMVTLILAMLAPLPYRIACQCTVQPVLRRFVAAPHDGILEQTLVDVGDTVDTNQVIARLDGRSLRVQRAGLQADFDGAKKRRDQSLATNDIARSQIATSEMQRFQSQLDLIHRRLENLEIRSPIAGMIVVGDLENAVGAPVEMGQTLFEIAPQDRMLAEIQIPEDEIQYVAKDMKVQIKVDSFPFKTFTGTIQRIHPSAEIIDGNSVFVADVQLPNTTGKLRPGMSGWAKVNSGWSPTAWNLFHRPWESVRHWIVW